MKKLFLLFMIILVVVSGCNLEPMVPSQEEPEKIYNKL